MFLVMFIASTSASSRQVHAANKDAGETLAVLDLEIIGSVDKYLSRPLADSIRHELVRSGNIEVIDRSHMDKVLKEQAFQMTGLVAPERAAAVGKMLGVGRIVVGSLSMIGKTYYLSLSQVNVETGKTEAVVEDSCKCEVDELLDAAKRAANKLIIATKIPSGNNTTGLPVKPVVSPQKTPGTMQDPTTFMEFLFVKGGCYTMGDTFGDGDVDENPSHEVCVDDFYMGIYEVTQGQWKSIMEGNPSAYKGGDLYPVEHASWDDAQAFVAKLRQKSGENYRLPTEAEWEYAARSKGKREKWAGTSDESELTAYAWFSNNTTGQTHPVGQKAPNSIGLYDMTGNVWEWVSDIYREKYYIDSPKRNPRGPDMGRNRVFRGGSWNDESRIARTTCRVQAGPSVRNRQSGFRIVLPLK